LTDVPQADQQPLPAGLTTPDHIMWKSLPEGVVLLNVETGEHYQLNETGMVVWSGIVQGRPIEAIAADLCREYDVNQPTARHDVKHVVDYLIAEGCLVPSEGEE